MDERVKGIEQVAEPIRGIRMAMLTSVDVDGDLRSRLMATHATSGIRTSISPPE
jgi:hypothetical protein